MSTVHYTLPDDARIIPDYPDYAISPDGTLFSRRDGVRGDPGRIAKFWNQLAPNKRSSGYRYAALVTAEGKKKEVAIHVLVLTTFIGPRPEGMMTRHLNGNPDDSRLENLCWGTPKENQEDRNRHGRTARGDRQPEAVLNVLRVEAILDLRSLGWGSRKLANLFGVDRRTIMFACDGSTWNHFCSEKRKKYAARALIRYPKKIAPEMAAAIQRRKDAGESLSSIAQNLGVTKQAICYHLHKSR